MGQVAEKIVPDGRVKIDLEKAVDLRLKGVPVADIATLFKVTETQVYRRLKRYKTDPGKIVDFRKAKANKLEFIQAEILASISPDDIKKTPFVQRVTSLAILEDKIRLIRGEPTQNVSVQGVLADISVDLSKAKEAINATINNKTVTIGTQDVVGSKPKGDDIKLPPDNINDNEDLA